MLKKEKILIAISGGVDSAVSAFLLKNKGYNIVGVFIRMINEKSKDEAMARNICQKLNIKFYSVNFFDIFQKEIINYFLDSYKNGITPNPCVKCNKIIKFGKLLKITKELNIKYLATGHYAIIKNNKLFRGKDKTKDQTYFLYNLTKKQLSNILFPLGEYTKEEIKKIAKKANLPYLKKESQDVCFLNKNGKITDHNIFLKKYLNLQNGKIKTLSGEIIGEHDGLPLYTIGQRKGIEVGGDGPYYVIKLDYSTNTLYVTNNPSNKLLEKDSFEIYNTNWISGKSLKISLKYDLVIRYRQKSEKCSITKNNKNYIVKLDNPQRAITPGQSAVLYIKNEVIGGGIIRSATKRIKTIGIDARFYGPANKGLGRYTEEIVDGVVNSDKNNKFVIFLCKENYHKFKTNNPRVKKVLTNVRWYSLSEQILMPYYIWREKVDLMHWTHFNVPFFCTFQKFIVTIHDLILIKFPTKRATTLSPFMYKIKNKCYQIIIKTAVKKSKKIISISKHAKEDIKQQFKINGDKIIVIYEGVSNTLKQNIKYDRKSILRYNINNPFILYVGNAYPHKNIEGLINAFEKVKQTNNNLLLVLIGKEDYFYKQIKEKAKKSKHSKDIIFPGFVPDKDLINFFKLALVYVFPSFYEGFGLPPLEAMQNGCPVVSSNKTCLPEILGNAVEYFNPENKNEMIEKINKLIDDRNLRVQLINNGYEQVKKYDWNKCIKETLEVYYNIFL